MRVCCTAAAGRGSYSPKKKGARSTFAAAKMSRLKESQRVAVKRVASGTGMGRSREVQEREHVKHVRKSFHRERRTSEHRKR